MSNYQADLMNKDLDLKEARIKVIALEEEIKKLVNAKQKYHTECTQLVSDLGKREKNAYQMRTSLDS
jgi:hypothetical protein